MTRMEHPKQLTEHLQPDRVVVVCTVVVCVLCVCEEEEGEGERSTY